MIRQAAKYLLVGFVVAVGACGCSSRSEVEHRNVAFDVAPDGQRIVFASADGDLYLFHLHKSEVVRLTTTARKEMKPAFSPDGKSIAFAAGADGDKRACLFTCSAEGQNLRQLTNDPAVSDSMPSYSRDGAQIVFIRAHRHRPYSMGGWTWDDWDLYVMKSNGTDVRRLTQGKYYSVSSPQFVDNGSAIVYSAEVGGAQGALGHSLFEVGVNGNQPMLVTQDRPAKRRGGAWASGPSVSPDGRSIAVISDRAMPYAYDVLVLNRDGTMPTPLGITSVADYNQSPRFLPDGKSILFLAGTERNAGSRSIYSLWQVDTDGKNPRRIAPSGLFTNPSQWKPRP